MQDQCMIDGEGFIVVYDITPMSVFFSLFSLFSLSLSLSLSSSSSSSLLLSLSLSLSLEEEEEMKKTLPSGLTLRPRARRIQLHAGRVDEIWPGHLGLQHHRQVFSFILFSLSLS